MNKRREKNRLLFSYLFDLHDSRTHLVIFPEKEKNSHLRKPFIRESFSRMKSPVTIRIELTTPDDEQTIHPPSFDFETITTILSPSKPKVMTKLAKRSSSAFDRTRTPRFSSLSSSYTQFLKQRDLDKNKKTVSESEISSMMNLFDF